MTAEMILCEEDADGATAGLYNSVTDAEFVAGLNNYIANTLSPKLCSDQPLTFPLASPGYHKLAWSFGDPSDKLKRKKPCLKLDLRSPFRHAHQPHFASNATSRPATADTMQTHNQKNCQKRNSGAASLDDYSTNMDSPTLPGSPAIVRVEEHTTTHDISASSIIEDSLFISIDAAIDDCLLTELKEMSPEIFGFLETPTLEPLYSPSQTSLVISPPRRSIDSTISSSACSPRTISPMMDRSVYTDLRSRREQFRNFKFDSNVVVDTPVAPQITQPARSQEHLQSIPESVIDRPNTSSTDRSAATCIMNRRLPAITAKRRAARKKVSGTLPNGCRAVDAHDMFSIPEIDVLKAQALLQASKFQVLKRQDIDKLSSELRSLEERCEYLRKTYQDLRSDRRSLQSRVCIMLRNSREATFSQDTLLKQEEALVELDLSIENWDNKLRTAEDRRTRIRQKLTEHIAATLTIPPSPEEARKHYAVRPLPTDPGLITPPRSPKYCTTEFDTPIKHSSTESDTVNKHSNTESDGSTKHSSTEFGKSSKHSSTEFDIPFRHPNTEIDVSPKRISTQLSTSSSPKHASFSPSPSPIPLNLIQKPVSRIILPAPPKQSVLRKRPSREIINIHTESALQKISLDAASEMDRLCSVKKLVRKLETLGNTASLPEKCQALGTQGLKE